MTEKHKKLGANIQTKFQMRLHNVKNEGGGIWPTDTGHALPPSIKFIYAPLPYDLLEQPTSATPFPWPPRPCAPEILQCDRVLAPH